MVTQCTRFDKLFANSESRKMDMYIQVSYLDLLIFLFSINQKKFHRIWYKNSMPN